MHLLLTASSAADDALNSAGAGDSIAVQTGSYHSDRALTLSEDSDVSTTAEEISTEVRPYVCKLI